MNIKLTSGFKENKEMEMALRKKYDNESGVTIKEFDFLEEIY